ncbi:MAG: hypothetical protein KDE63_10460 [Novosphingobium sp.]|nr:hypothetical protein [Novosphingobium sp.]
MRRPSDFRVIQVQPRQLYRDRMLISRGERDMSGSWTPEAPSASELIVILILQKQISPCAVASAPAFSVDMEVKRKDQ